eukprot:56941-Rhodomonas_salina.1
MTQSVWLWAECALAGEGIARSPHGASGHSLNTLSWRLFLRQPREIPALRRAVARSAMSALAEGLIVFDTAGMLLV